MKKIYSFVLMAAALLVGTNAWAAYQIGGTTHPTLQAALNAADDGDEIVVTPVGGGLNISTQVELSTGKHVILNLGDNAIEFSGTPSGKAAFVVSRGILEITGNGGQISSNAEGIYDLISVRGTSELIDAKVSAPYSQVIVRGGVTIKNEKYNAITVTENADKLANGARVDVYSSNELDGVKGQKYGIKVNGNVRDPYELGYPEANRQYTPYIYIAGNVKTIDNSPNAVAAYSSGYARWRIEGTCSGATGVYAKSGDVEIVGATITSTAPFNTDAVMGKGSGVQAGGSAIVIESNSNYSGNIEVTIAESTISAPDGFAIQETVSSSETKVENITIVSGTIQGGNQGAIIVSQKTVTDPDADVVILGGNISSENNDKPLQIEGDNTTSESDIINLLIPNGFQGDTPEATTSGTTTSLVIKTGYYPTLNAYGLATFSAEETTLIPTGLKAYTATGEIEEDKIVLNPISGTHIPANTGVILYKEDAANTSFTLIIDGSADAIVGNYLKPYTAWANRGDYAYVLSANQLYLYNGATMPANKAFLDLPAPHAQSGAAPKRIQMVFAETQDVENIEAGVKAEKFIENGQIFIIRGENIYNVQGQIVK